MQNKQKILSVSIKDCEIQTFTCGGKGGSGKDTSNTGVRIIHKPSGAVGECREERHQHINKQRAFKKMAQSPQMQNWLKQESLRIIGKLPDIEKRVDELMEQQYLKVEYLNND